MKNIKLTMAAAAAFMAMGTMVGCSEENSSSAESPLSETQNATNVSARCMDHSSFDTSISLAKDATTIDYATVEATENGAHIVLPPFTTSCGYAMEFTYEKSNDTLYVTSKGVEGQPLADCICNTSYEFDVNVAPGDFHYLNYGKMVYDIQDTGKTIPVESSSSLSSQISGTITDEVTKCIRHIFNTSNENEYLKYATVTANNNESHIFMSTYFSQCGDSYEFYYKMSNDTLFISRTRTNEFQLDCGFCDMTLEFSVNIPAEEIHAVYLDANQYPIVDEPLIIQEPESSSSIASSSSFTYEEPSNVTKECLAGTLDTPDIAFDATGRNYAIKDDIGTGSHIILPTITTSTLVDIKFGYRISNDTLYVVSTVTHNDNQYQMMCRASYEFDVNVHPEQLNHLNFDEKAYMLRYDYVEELKVPIKSSSSEEIVPPIESSSSVAVMEGFEIATHEDGRCVDYPSSNDAGSLAEETSTVDYATAEATENGSHIVLPPIMSTCGSQFENQYKMSNDTLYVVSTVIESTTYANCICHTAYEFDVNVFPGNIHYLNNNRYGKETIYDIHNITMGYERVDPFAYIKLFVADNELGNCLSSGLLKSSSANSLAKESATDDYVTVENTENGAHIVLPSFTTSCGYKLEFEYGMSNDTLYVKSKGVEGQPLADCICDTAYEFDVQIPAETIDYLYYGRKVYEVH